MDLVTIPKSHLYDPSMPIKYSMGGYAVCDEKYDEYDLFSSISSNLQKQYEQTHQSTINNQRMDMVTNPKSSLRDPPIRIKYSMGGYAVGHGNYDQ